MLRKQDKNCRGGCDAFNNIITECRKRMIKMEQEVTDHIGLRLFVCEANNLLIEPQYESLMSKLLMAPKPKKRWFYDELVVVIRYFIIYF